MEIKAVMHQLLPRFRATALPRYRWSVPAGYAPPIGYGTGPMPTDGLPIRLEPLTAA